MIRYAAHRTLTLDVRPRRESITMSRKTHNERCHDCKKSVRNLLAALFGAVEVNWHLDLFCRLEDFINTSLYDTLGVVHEALQKNRGFNQFVMSNNLPRVDFFIPDRKLIIEFDESQHFTKPRDLALSLYPNGQDFGFSLKRWRTLCQELDRGDNDPPYRDEQRAWYDTLRDFAPIITGAGQTYRLYSRDLVWCSLNSHSESDLRTFKLTIINSKSG